MPNVKLLQLDQSAWLSYGGVGGGPSRGGVCYYLCNYLESDVSGWNSPGSFAVAISNAKNFVAVKAVNFAKAQSLRKAPQTDGSKYSATTLNPNTIFRVGVYIGNVAGSPANHEMMAITGTGTDIVYFDPEFWVLATFWSRVVQ